MPQSVHGRAEAAEPERREPSPVAAGARGSQGLDGAAGPGGMVWARAALLYGGGGRPSLFRLLHAPLDARRVLSLLVVGPSPIIHLPGPRSNPSGSAVA